MSGGPRVLLLLGEGFGVRHKGRDEGTAGGNNRGVVSMILLHAQIIFPEPGICSAQRLSLCTAQGAVKGRKVS